MTKEVTVYQEIEEFVKGWQEQVPVAKECFVSLLETIKSLDGISCTFSARPGVSYSLRPRHFMQRNRDFFMVLDVIDDDPGARWLSICFYDDLVTDPEGRGEVIPGGLPDGDGYCFNLLNEDRGFVEYLKKRCVEACSALSEKARCSSAP